MHACNKLELHAQAAMGSSARGCKREPHMRATTWSCTQGLRHGGTYRKPCMQAAGAPPPTRRNFSQNTLKEEGTPRTRIKATHLCGSGSHTRPLALRSG